MGEHRLRPTSGGEVEGFPDWSPDGALLAFARGTELGLGSGQADIYVVRADGLDEERLTYSGAVEVQPKWSIDGTRILYASDQMGSFDLWIMDADGHHADRLTDEPTDELDAVWDPTGDRVAYSVYDPGIGPAESGSTWTMAADGSDRTLLIDHLVTPSYSPDGSVLVTGGLALVDASTAEVIRVLDVGAAPDVPLAEPVWSPDGNWIAYRRGPTGPSAEIYLVSRDGTEQLRVTENSTFDGFPDWG